MYITCHLIAIIVQGYNILQWPQTYSCSTKWNGHVEP